MIPSAICVCLVLLVSVEVKGRPDGPPYDPAKSYTFCQDLTPRHYGEISQSLAGVPANVTAERISNRTVRVTLAGAYGGFILQGRDSQQRAVGMFQALDSALQNHAQIVKTCSGETTVGHNNPNPKPELVFIWEAPAEAVSVTFSATFVQSGNARNFWGPTKGLEVFNFDAAPTTLAPTTLAPTTVDPTTSADNNGGGGGGGSGIRSTPSFMMLGLVAMTLMKIFF